MYVNAAIFVGITFLRQNLNVSGIALSPEDLLSLGNKQTDGGEYYDWQTYWKLIVEVVDTKAADYLTKVRKLLPLV